MPLIGETPPIWTGVVTTEQAAEYALGIRADNPGYRGHGTDTGHRNVATVRVYTRRADALADHAGERLL